MRGWPVVAIGLVAAIVTMPGPAYAGPVKRTSAKVTKSVTRVTAGQRVTLTITARPARGRRIARYALSFGDGTRALRGVRLGKRRVAHVYAKAGSYTARLTVTDNRGRTVTAKLKVKVRLPNGLSSGTPVLPGAPSAGHPVTPPVVTPPPVSAPASPLDLAAGRVELAPGSAAIVSLPAPLASVTRIDTITGTGTSATAGLTDNGLRISTRADAALADHTITLTGVGCTVGQCDHPLTLRVPITIHELAAPAEELHDFTSASPDRIADGTPLPGGGTALKDELVVTFGTPDNPGTRTDADSAAAAVDAVVSGGIDAIGVFELRWTAPQDLDARRAQLLALPGVTDADDTLLGLYGTHATPPGDWNDDGGEVKWPFDVTKTQQAWDQTTGSGVKVGIIDENLVFGSHEDLDVVKSIGRNGAGTHATHVAGTACARANGKGIVGFAWGCPIVSADWGDGTDKQVVAAMTAVAQAGARVANISLGLNNNDCADQGRADYIHSVAMDQRPKFRQLLRGTIGRDVIWTMSAGNNCAPYVGSGWGANSDLGNVIAVAAINSDRQLSSFSDFGEGVELAAPGGVSVAPYGNGSQGIWSTMVSDCWGFFNCGTYADHDAEKGGLMVGTSMAAPAVAGIAALVRAKHPSYGASRAAGCITGSAGTGGVGSVTQRSGLPNVQTEFHWQHQPQIAFGGSIPIVNAKAAVDCEALQFDGSVGTDVPPTTLGGHAMTAFGLDGNGLNGAVSRVDDPAGTLLFGPDLTHLRAGNGWATWSHGYTGDVYFSGERNDPTIEITLPAGTQALSFYAEPNTFASFTVEALASDGTSSEPVDIDGYAGARYFGFYGTGGRTISSVTVTASDPSGFAIGEFMISR
jgi:hypothetical protein